MIMCHLSKTSYFVVQSYRKVNIFNGKSMQFMKQAHSLAFFIAISHLKLSNFGCQFQKMLLRALYFEVIIALKRGSDV